MKHLNISRSLKHINADTIRSYINNWLVIYFITLISFSGCTHIGTSKKDAKDNSGRYVINGTIKGVASGTIFMFSSAGKKLDSAAIEQNKFAFHGKIGLPERGSFSISPGNWTFMAFVDGPNITINADTSFSQHQYSNKTTDHPIIWQISQTGSAMGDAYTKYQNETGVTNYLHLANELKTAKNASSDHIHHQMDSIAGLITSKQRNWIEKYVHQDPSSLTGAYIFNEFLASSPGISAIYLRSIFGQFSGTAKRSSYYASINKKLLELGGLHLGEITPNFTLQKRDKSKFDLTTTRGSVILLDFWASWCVPCRKGIPHWKKIYEKYHSKNLNIVSISGDRNRQNWIKALDQEKMPWTQVIDELSSKTSRSVVTDLYGVNAIPFFVLLNKKGELILASDNEATITKKIEEIFW